ncbi:DUF1275 domain-containing protein [Chitinophaga oryziterrae]|uniref:DUF1275 domain-containing protein n=1 Tax=Chitinophaga oryziterrae TaxID=1031224 RepID=A0A6N8JAX4_9BACT|nr:YoaK family protein [Chitinophaga oryziterrae]MVT42380.1 DUF1275 domain-containing protein [Chitinophaga oryziterrae]
MEQQNNIWSVTLLLSAVAGYCDTVTFVAADTIFSAHVTGNFIVFAYQMIKGSDLQAWIKLLTFPVFILAVMTGGWIKVKSSNQYILLLCQGAILLIAGLTAMLFHALPVYLIAMLVVFAMGLQNAFGKLFAKETYGPTTMMTGNVTQLSLDTGALIRGRLKDAIAWESMKKQLITIGGFLAGCLLGAVIAQRTGLNAIILPGIAMIVCYFSTHKKTV